MKGLRSYFASDFHLGLAAGTNPRERETRVTDWLEEASEDAAAFYLLGDLFDFWWEYKTVIPKGFTRFLGTLASVSDRGISLHIFTGNHDMWMRDYLSKECGAIIHHKPQIVTIGNATFYLAHGEGLGSRSTIDRMIFALFRSPASQTIFSALHPRTGMALAHAWSNSSRLAKHVSLPFMGPEREDLVRHTRELVSDGCPARYFIYGHRHLPLALTDNQCKIILLGDWFTCRRSYAVYDGNDLTLVSEPLVL